VTDGFFNHERPPLRDVRRIIYVRGARGGRQVALVLECGHWITRRRAPRYLEKGIACIGCLVQKHIDAEATG
jgi:hypothetical protein